MIKGKFTWAGKNKGDDKDKKLLAGWHDKGGVHIATLLSFYEKHKDFIIEEGRE